MVVENETTSNMNLGLDERGKRFTAEFEQKFKRYLGVN